MRIEGPRSVAVVPAAAASPARTAPDEATALVRLLNTRPHAGAEDTLTSDTAAAALADLPGAGSGDLDLPVIRALRDALAAAVGGDEDAWERVDALASGPLLRRRFRGGRAGFEVVADESGTAAVLAAVAALLEQDAFSRLRICGNDLCELVFFDTTRNRTQRWDSYATCGNRANVAAHRARRRSAADS